MKLFPFYGPMQIEMNILSCHGELIKGTGLKEVLKTSGLATVGLTVALFDANNLKRVRYTVQLLTPVLCVLLKKAYAEQKKTISL